MCARMGDFRQCGFVPAAKRSFPVGEVFQLSLQHTRTHTPAHGSLIGLCSRMPDSLKILVNVETDTMECFVRDVSASVLPERIFLSKRHQSGQKCVCVRACVRVWQADRLLWSTYQASPPALLFCFFSISTSLSCFLSLSLSSPAFAEGILWHLEGVSCSTFLRCLGGMSSSQQAAELQLDHDFSAVVVVVLKNSLRLYHSLCRCFALNDNLMHKFQQFRPFFSFAANHWTKFAAYIHFQLSISWSIS